MSDHFIEQCSCGAIIAQCRCPAPDKSITYVERGCPACKAGPYPTNEQSPAFQELWKEAIGIQNAVNLSGLSKRFAQVTGLLWEIDRQNQNIGTDWVNSNHVTRLWVDKFIALAGLSIDKDWSINVSQ